MRLVLIRHGETDHNRDQVTLGRSDVPLNERGRAQSAAAAASFRAAPAAIYASPLRRAVELAEAISAVVDVRPERATLLQLNDTSHLIAAGLADDLVGREARA